MLTALLLLTMFACWSILKSDLFFNLHWNFMSPFTEVVSGSIVPNHDKIPGLFNDYFHFSRTKNAASLIIKVGAFRLTAAWNNNNLLLKLYIIIVFIIIITFYHWLFWGRTALLMLNPNMCVLSKFKYYINVYLVSLYMLCQCFGMTAFFECYISHWKFYLAFKFNKYSISAFF